RPTAHRVYGEGTAIIVGDALLADAFAVMARARGVPPERALAAIAEVAAAAGEAGMVGGQALDLAAAGTRPTLGRVRTIHRRKTGALFVGASPAVLGRLTAYAAHLGLAFQIADDILDAGEAPRGDGRTDRALGKATYPALVGLAGARRHALRERDAALAALRPLGRRAEPLRALVTWVVGRALEPAEWA